jgi:hypothetical protein
MRKKVAHELEKESKKSVKLKKIQSRIAAKVIKSDY